MPIIETNPSYPNTKDSIPLTTPTTIIDSEESLSLQHFCEIWHYRELFVLLSWKDLKIRYKQTILGIGWVVLQPLLSVLIFTVFFGKLAKLPSDGINYSLFALSGLLPWTFFLNGVSNASNSIVNDANLIKKIYFPRSILPLSKISSGVFDFLLTFVILICAMPFLDCYPTLRLALLPVFLLFLMMTTIGIGLWLAALNTLFRDIKHIIPFFLQLWLFLSPVVYPLTIIPESWRNIYALNPMVGILESFRWMTIGSYTNATTEIIPILISLVVSVLLFLSGSLFFRKIENSFADVA